jgi:hypothetical protein
MDWEFQRDLCSNRILAAEIFGVEKDFSQQLAATRARWRYCKSARPANFRNGSKTRTWNAVTSITVTSSISTGLTRIGLLLRGLEQTKRIESSHRFLFICDG